MFRNLIILFSVPAILNLSLSAQQKRITDDRILLRGVVFEILTREILPGSQIFINGSYNSSGRDDGSFSLLVSRNDTLVFTMLGFSPEQLIISDTLKAREFLTGVYLTSDTLEIGEVIILPRFSNMKAEMMNPSAPSDPKLNNARSNLSISSYQGRTSQSSLGDPINNYELLRQKQKLDAYEKGHIPSDRLITFNAFILIPAAYMLLHGVPEKPRAPEPKISSKEIEELNKRYLESIRHK